MRREYVSLWKVLQAFPIIMASSGDSSGSNDNTGVFLLLLRLEERRQEAACLSPLVLGACTCDRQGAGSLQMLKHRLIPPQHRVPVVSVWAELSVRQSPKPL